MAKRKSLAYQLKRAIGMTGESTYWLSKQTGIAPAVLSRFLSGERDLRLETVEKIAAVLQLNFITDQELQNLTSQKDSK